MSKELVFIGATIRKQDKVKLQKIAKITDRSQSAVLRLLIRAAKVTEHGGLVLGAGP